MTWSSTATRGVTGPRRPLGGLGGFGSLAFSIPLGFRTGRPFSPLSRAISSRWAATVCSRAATLPSNSMTRAFSSVGESASRSPGGAILPGNQRSTGQESEKRAATSFAAGTITGPNPQQALPSMRVPNALPPSCYRKGRPQPRSNNQREGAGKAERQGYLHRHATLVHLPPAQAFGALIGTHAEA
jgi:hypothetical protein